MILTVEQAREKYIGKPVSGWTCACGACKGKAGEILTIEEDGFSPAPWGFIVEVGTPGHESSWSTDLHSLFPEASAGPIGPDPRAGKESGP